MKYIQSLWLPEEVAFQPRMDTEENEITNKCWRVSNKLLQKQKITTEFWGNSHGLAYAENSGLVYDYVHKIPDELDNLITNNPRLYALVKIFAASQQDGPFLHVDGDIFLEGKIPTFPATALHLEEGVRFFAWYWSLRAHIDQVAPIELLEQLDSFYDIESNIQCYNYGVFGGSDVKVLKRVYGQVVELCHQIESNLSSAPKVTFLSCAIEQIVAPALIQINGCQIDCIYGNTPMGFGHAAIAGEKYRCRHIIGQSKLEPKYNKLILEKFEQLFT